MFTLLLFASNYFLINPVIYARTLPPLSIIATIHSIRTPHTMSPPNDDVTRGSILCTYSMMMSPMDPHYTPLNDNVSHGSKLCLPQ